MGKENRPTCSKLLSLRQPSAVENKEGDTVYAMCESTTIGHEGPDVPKYVASSQEYMLLALLCIATYHCLCLQLYKCQGLLAYLMFSRGSLGCFLLLASFIVETDNFPPLSVSIVAAEVANSLSNKATASNPSYCPKQKQP